MKLSDDHMEKRDVACDRFRDATEAYNLAVRANARAVETAHDEICKAWEVFNRAVISLRVTAHSIGDDLSGPMRTAWRGFDAEPPLFPTAPSRTDFATDASMGGFEDLPTTDDADDAEDENE